MAKIRVLIIDDSAVVREILAGRLGRDPRIEVVGTAVDPYSARDKMAALAVDVITLDIEMPRMDGLTFLGHLMRQNPMPVVIVSSVAARGNQAGIQALELGASDIVPKPGGPFSVEEVADLLAEKIVAAAAMDLSKLRSGPLPPPTSLTNRNPALSRIVTTNKLVAMGASTGGTQAYEEVFKRLPGDIPPVLAVIHMPAGFTASFAKRLNDLSTPRVCEAQDGQTVTAGTVYLAPGGVQMAVRTRGSQRIIKLFHGPKVWSQRPAVDVLFDSVADQIGPNAVGVLMTGMGCDGAQGLLHMKQAGARTVCQDEKTSIVFGMPKEAISLGAADRIVALEEIAQTVVGLLKNI